MNHARIQLFQGPGRPFESRTVPLPDRLNPGEMLVEISLATVCGSDLHTVSGRRGAPTPCVLGHEAIGRVVASERPGFSEGQRVTWTLADSCGECPACTEWVLPQKCLRLFKYGHAALNDGSGLNGCYASHIVLRSGTFVLPVPDGLKDALVAPANCALATIVNALEIRGLWEEGTFLPHLTSPQGERDGRLAFDIEQQTNILTRPFGVTQPRSERAGVRGGSISEAGDEKRKKRTRTALVQGGGLLGLYACAWLRFCGVERVFCTDLSAERLSMVAEFGGIAVPADEHMKKRILEESGGGVDLALEVAGSAAVIPDGIALLRPGATYVWAGMVHPQTALELTGEAVLRKCLTIRGVHNYAPRHLGIGLDFLAAMQDRLPFEKLVSPPLPLDALDEALRLTESRRWLRVSITS